MFLIRQFAGFAEVRFYTATLLLLLSAGVALAESQSPRAAVSLFNGRNLDGFSTWLVDKQRADPRVVFAIADGMLRISGDGLGYLATTGEYRDYRLTLEYRWGRHNTRWGDRLGKARDSGVFLHATGPNGNSDDGGGAFMAAIECNLFEGATGDLLLIRGRAADGSLIAPRFTAEVAPTKDADDWFTWLRGGRRQTIERWGRLNWFGKSPEWRDEFGFRGRHDAEKAAGEWNTLECVCDGERIQIVLNGVLVNEAFDVSPRAGKILLQCEGSEIYFRNIALQPVRWR
jgi:hypothetical protein